MPDRPIARPPVALCVSPHLDDAAFSCGGTLARLVTAGWAVHVATVFTASVPDPRGFALACQTDKGLPADADYMAIRRDEDAVAMRALGAAPHWLPLREAPHRGYASPPALFAGVHEADGDAWRDVVAALAPLVARLAPGLLLAPQALGGHADHRHVVRAVGALAADARGTLPVAWYRDTPYVLRDPDARPPAPLDDGETGALATYAVPLDGPALAARQAACAAYGTQLPFQFGGTDGMRAAIAGLAAADGAAVGVEYAERLAARPDVGALLARVLDARAVDVPARLTGVGPA